MGARRDIEVESCSVAGSALRRTSSASTSCFPALPFGMLRRLTCNHKDRCGVVTRRGTPDWTKCVHPELRNQLAWVQTFPLTMPSARAEN